MIFPYGIFHIFPMDNSDFSQVCAADWSPSGLLSRVAEGSFHALIDTGSAENKDDDDTTYIDA